MLWRGKFAAGIVALSIGKTAESANTESGGGISAVCMEIFRPGHCIFMCGFGSELCVAGGRKQCETCDIWHSIIACDYKYRLLF